MVAVQYYPEILTNVVAGLLVIGFGILLGNIFSVVSRKALQSFEVERILQDFGLRFPLEEFTASVLKYGIYLAGLIFGLTFLGLQAIVLYIVLFTILGMLLLFIILAFKDFIPNFVAGLFLHFRERLRVGEVVAIDSIEGKVIRMDMLETKIRTTDGDVVVMPNVLISRSMIIKKRK